MVLVHAADLHLDSPLRGLERAADVSAHAHEREAAHALRGATRRAFAAIVDLCLADGAAALLVAGDVFDGDWKDVNTGIFFTQQLARLQEAGTQVYLVQGNHDHADHPINRGYRWRESHVHMFEHLGSAPVVDEARGLAVHGVSYPTREVRSSLLPLFGPPRRDLFNVGLLHTNAVGTSAHAAYAPTSVPELVAHGFDYWALGHVHTRQTLAEHPRWVAYPGNPQGRHPREPGPRGCLRVEVDEATLAVREVRFVVTDVVRWERVEVDVGEAGTVDEVRERVAAAMARAHEAAGSRILGCRLRLVGEGPGHEVVTRHARALEEELRLDASRAWIERMEIATRGARAAPAPFGVPQEVEDLVARLTKNREELTELLSEDLAALKRLPHSLQGLGDGEEDAEDPTAPEHLAALLHAARELAHRSLLGEPLR